MKAWKGALIGGIVGIIISIIPLVVNVKTSYCGFTIKSFFCSLIATLNEYGLFSMIFSMPKIFFRDLYGVSGFGEIIIIPSIIITGFVIGLLLSYLIARRK